MNIHYLLMIVYSYLFYVDEVYPAGPEIQ